MPLTVLADEDLLSGQENQITESSEDSNTDEAVLPENEDEEPIDEIAEAPAEEQAVTTQSMSKASPKMLNAPVANNSVVFVPVSPDNEYDVRINGEGKIVTIYCLQQKERWPYDDDNVHYINHSEAGPGDYVYYNLLNDEEIQILRKLVYAGYPSDSQGYLRKFAEEFGWYSDEMGGYVTNSSIWALMTEWGKAGSDQNQVVDYENASGDPFMQAIVDMILFAKGDNSVEPPASDTILIEGSVSFQEILTAHGLPVIW